MYEKRIFLKYWELNINVQTLRKMNSDFPHINKPKFVKYASMLFIKKDEQWVFNNSYEDSEKYCVSSTYI